MAIVAFTFLLVLAIVLGAYFALIVRPETFERSTLLRVLARAHPGVLKSQQLERPTERLSNVRVHRAGALACERCVRTAGPPRHPVGSEDDRRHADHDVGPAWPVIGFVVVKALTYYTYLGLAAAPVFGLIPYFFVRYARSRRMQLFEEQFPESIELIARALRAGHAFPTGLQMVADEIADPVGSRVQAGLRPAEFRHVPQRRAQGTRRARADSRRQVLRDRGAHAARNGRQPVGGARQPRRRHPRAVQGQASGARGDGPRPDHRMDPGGAASRCSP